MPGAALGPVLKYLEFDTVKAEFPYAIHLDGDYYAVSYTESYASAWLKTFRIETDGTISIINTWNFATSVTYYPRLYHITSDLYLMTGSPLYTLPSEIELATIHISNTGVITKSFDDTVIIAGKEWPGLLVQITGAYYALFALESPNAHYVKTYTIVAGAAGITEIDSFKLPYLGYGAFEAGKIGTNIFFVIFTCDAYYKIVTVDISGIGSIDTLSVKSQDFTIACGHSFIEGCNVTSNIIALAIWDSDTNDLMIHTVKINSDGSIQATLAGSLNFGTCVAPVPGICYTGSGDRYFVVWPGTDQDGYIDIVVISVVGVISDDPFYSALEFDIGNCVFPQPLAVNGAFMPVIYRGVDDDGWVKSITFTPPAEAPHHEMIMGIGP